MAREQNDGREYFLRVQVLDHLHAGHSGHAEIKHDAARALEVVVIEKLPGASVLPHFHAEGHQKKPLALTEIRIVVDEPHDWVQILHALSPSHSFRAASGKLSTTTTPPASRRANFMDAPCPSAMPLQIPRPIPSP